MEDVCVGFGPPSGRTEVLSGASLRVEENELLAVIGFSGSGKSTMVSLLAGLTRPDSGIIRCDGRTVEGPGPERAIVFQNYSLLPWLSVFGNVEIAVRQVFPKLSRRERREHVERHIEKVRLGGSEWKKPHELSGGMRQRLALARAIAMSPRVLLLDEPLSALDALTRSSLQDEILRIWEEERRTVVLVTNDVDEALLMADRLVVLEPGPRASFGREFRIDLPRPRNRSELNQDDAFKRLRIDVTRHLVAIQSAARQRRTREPVSLPDIEPIHRIRDLRRPVGVS